MACLLLFMLVRLFLVTANSGSNCPNRQSIEQSLNKVHIPGAVIVVVNASDILYEQAFGYHSLSPTVPMDVDNSIFTLASISKTFIAIAVMQLVEKELVDLDIDINQYLAESHQRIFHPRYPTHSITLRKLLSHSASIAVSNQTSDSFFQPGDTALTQMTLADMCFTYLNPNTSNWLPKPPGTVSFYSNEGSSLAALVVERRTNISYDQYVKENILKPLNIDIRKTGVRLTDFENKGELVTHYAYALNESFLSIWNQELPRLNITQIPGNFPTWLYIPFFSFSAYPSGLLRMSGRSLSVYLRMFINNGSSLLSPRSIAEIRTVVGGGLIPYYFEESIRNSTDLPSTPKFGLSWHWQTLSNGHRYIGHSGSVPGMTNLMLVNEKNTIGVILLSNADTSVPIDLSRDTYNTIVNTHMALFQCFDADVVNSSGFSANSVNLFMLFYCFLAYFDR